MLSQTASDWCWHLHPAGALEIFPPPLWAGGYNGQSGENGQVQGSHHGNCKSNLRSAGLKPRDEVGIMTLSHNARLRAEKNMLEFLKGSLTLSSRQGFTKSCPIETNKLSTEALTWLVLSP